MPTFLLTNGDDSFPRIGDDNSGDDVVNGFGGNDILDGGAGDDSLNGDTGRDRLHGGAGRDTLDGGAGNDVLEGGGGGDVLRGADGNDTLAGGTGNDVLEGGTGRNRLRGEAGNDLFRLGEGRDRAFGGTGDDTFVLNNSGGGTVDGNAGHDRILAGITTNLTLYQIAGVERLVIDDGIPALFHAIATVAQYRAFAEIRDSWTLSDVTWLLVADGGAIDFGARISAGMTLKIELASAEGNTVTLGRGDDVVIGNEGDDSLFGRAGDDTLQGGGGDDFLNGGKGADRLDPGTGHNVVIFDDPGDVYVNGGGTDTGRTALASFTMPTDLFRLEYTGKGDATLTGNSGIAGRGDNEIIGGNGDDRISGGGADVFNGDDLLSGRGGDDTLLGGHGADTLDGGSGDDDLSGDEGNDVLIGGLGADRLSGGAGSDRFLFTNLAQSGPAKTKRDVIADFQTGDLIDVSAIDARAGKTGDQAFVLDTDGSFSAEEIRQSVKGGNLLLEFNADTDAAPEMTILLLGTTLLSETDFIL